MSFTRFRERSHDVQDGVERHVFGKVEYPEVGATIKVRGTDTKDEEGAVLYVGGTSFNLKENSNTEIFLVSSSSDTMLKIAIMTPPKDKQRRWKESTGGIQHPTDPEHVLEFNDTRAHVTKDHFAVGPKGTFEVKGNEVYLRAEKVIIEGELIVNRRIKTPEVVADKEPIPALTNPAQQAPKTQSGGSGTT